MIIQQLGIQDYVNIWEKMQAFTANRNPDTIDEIWILEHFPVYTQGQAGKPEHLLNPNGIPVVQTDRGGQITYHGPGQIIVYFMLNCQKNQIGIRQLVTAIEDLCVKVLAEFNIHGEKRCKAPGVYVQEAKIASLGLRIKNHCSYHGLALNVDMDLSPFLDINPCGFEKMRMTQMIEHQAEVKMNMVQEVLQFFLPRLLESQGVSCNS